MNSHLSITVDGKQLVLPKDFSIDIEDQNPMFNTTEMFSYPVKIPLAGNGSVLQNVGDINSDLRPVEMEHKSMRMTVDGMPFRSGTAVMMADEDVEDALSVNMDASVQSFDDLIGDLSCRDIPLKDEILIGEKIGNVKVSVTYKYKVKGKKKHGTKFSYEKENNTASGSVDIQALGFSYPARCVEENTSTRKAVKSSERTYPNKHSVVVPKVAESYINTSEAYPNKPYCNARVCYKHKALADDGSTADSTINQKDCTYQNEDLYPYWVLDANRPQSGLCFYVLYFLDCLFAHLGVSFDNSALTAIEDFKHLCFYTTHCKYTEKKLHGSVSGSERAGFFNSFDEINGWLDSRGCGGKIEIEDPETKQLNSFTMSIPDFFSGEMKSITYTVGKDGVQSISVSAEIKSKAIQADIMGMYASSDNFPDKSVSSVIKALENSFGIKFYYDYEQKKVTAYLLRDLFRNRSTPIHLPGRVDEIYKVSEKITGVRMIYSAESDAKEQSANIKNKVYNYDTDYDYIDYPKERTVTDKTYTDIFQKLSSGDKNVYVDMNTGNAYRIKVSSEAKSASELKPVLFEVGAFKGVEYGDCSTINDDFITELSSDFQPVSFNDVNYYQELEAVSSKQGSGGWIGDDGNSYTISAMNDMDAKQQPILCAYIDEDMEHEFVKQKIRSTISTSFVDLYVTQVLQTVESYDPSGTEDGNSPLQHYDWGLAVALMRGGGSDATVQEYDFDYDGFGNGKWRTVAGNYALATDSIDNFGNQYDYNGKQDGIGDGERFSLKIRAYKQPSWSAVPLCKTDELDDTTGKIKTKIRSRGLFDTFMSEYAYFLLNRKRYSIRMTASAAVLADIPNHWRERFEIGGKVGYINKVSYTVSSENGVGEAEIDFYSI